MSALSLLCGNSRQGMPHTDEIAALEARRARLRRELADLRPGSLGSRRLRHGNPRCRGKRPGEPRHGPYWYLTRKRLGKTVAHSIPAVLVDRRGNRISEYQRLKASTEKLVEVSDELCHVRLVQFKQAIK